jgi:hypothetical protein
MKPVATSSPQAKTPVVICCQPSWVLLPPYFNLLTGGSIYENVSRYTGI